MLDFLRSLFNDIEGCVQNGYDMRLYVQNDVVEVTQLGDEGRRFTSRGIKSLSIEVDRP